VPGYDDMPAAGDHRTVGVPNHRLLRPEVEAN
jgi:hypothetical protein